MNLYNHWCPWIKWWLKQLQWFLGNEGILMTWKNSNNEYKTKLNSCVKKISRIHIQFVKKIYTRQNISVTKEWSLHLHIWNGQWMFYMFSNFNYLLFKMKYNRKWKHDENFSQMTLSFSFFPPFKNQFAYSLNPLSQNNSFTHRNRHPLLKWVGLVLGVSLYFELQDLL